MYWNRTLVGAEHVPGILSGGATVLLHYCTTVYYTSVLLYYRTTVLLYDKVPANKRGFLVTPVGFRSS